MVVELPGDFPDRSDTGSQKDQGVQDMKAHGALSDGDNAKAVCKYGDARC